MNPGAEPGPITHGDPSPAQPRPRSEMNIRTRLTPALSLDSKLVRESERALPEAGVEIVYA